MKPGDRVQYRHDGEDKAFVIERMDGDVAVLVRAQRLGILYRVRAPIDELQPIRRTA